MVIYIRNDNVCKRMAVMQNEKGCALEERGSERESEREHARERVNPVTVSGEHSGVVRGLYKTLSMNDSKHLNDREMGRGKSSGVCVCAWLWV